MLKAFAAILALSIELAMLWAYAAWGFELPVALPARIAAGLALIATVGAIWGAFLAPRAKRRLPILARAIAKIVVFAGGAILEWTMNEPVFAGAITLFAAISLILEYIVRVPEIAARPEAS